MKSDGFSQIGSEGNWYGITVSGDHVRVISLQENNLSGSIPAELENLRNLDGLGLSVNQLSGSIRPELGNLSNLRFLALDFNQLSGSIPPELGNLSNLEELYLHINQLSGSIPSVLGNLSNLERLWLYDNQLSGSIPPKLGNLSDLVWLDLENNQLSGNIPPELGNLKNLWYLYLGFNQLSGSIPVELGNLSNLEGLRLSSNQLICNIPSSLGNLANLSSDYNYYTDIGYNGLYTNDDTLRTFLNGKDPDWEDTQTIAPANVSASAISNSSIRVSWIPITYTGNTGSYKVYYSTTSGGPWTYAGMTANKSASSYDVTGLSPGTTYYLVVKTQTNPHYYNDNTVISEYSEGKAGTVRQNVKVRVVSLS